MHKKIICLCLICFSLISLFVTKVEAIETETRTENEENNIIIEDEAKLLTTEEKQKLRDQMAILSEYGIVLFRTTNIPINSTSLKYIQNYYYSKYENKAGVAFYIDMYNRQICACATGGLEKKITSGKCDTIMDNVYMYARKGNYYDCAKETFVQMNRVLSGQKIAQKMKYICNAFVAIMIASFSSYGIFMIASKNKRASQKELINECETYLKHSDIDVNRAGTHRVYSPRSEGGSSGGGFSGGGGSSGGGFSGSGGSHGF